MKNKVIKLKLTSRGIDKAIKELEEWQKWIEEKTKDFLYELSKEGIQIMSAKFSEAIYDGSNVVTCEIEERGENKVALLAIGTMVLFIEFGTGVKYPDDHPEAHTDGHEMNRGEYGKGKGANPNGWRYVGEAGTQGELSPNARKKSVMHTYGNPANMCMYNTKKELAERFEEIARRVFV